MAPSYPFSSLQSGISAPNRQIVAFFIFLPGTPGGQLSLGFPRRGQVAALERLRHSFGPAVFDRSMWDFSMRRPQEGSLERGHLWRFLAVVVKTVLGARHILAGLENSPPILEPFFGGWIGIFTGGTGF